VGTAYSSFSLLSTGGAQTSFTQYSVGSGVEPTPTLFKWECVCSVRYFVRIRQSLDKSCLQIWENTVQQNFLFCQCGSISPLSLLRGSSVNSQNHTFLSLEKPSQEVAQLNNWGLLWGSLTQIPEMCGSASSVQLPGRTLLTSPTALPGLGTQRAAWRLRKQHRLVLIPHKGTGHCPPGTHIFCLCSVLQATLCLASSNQTGSSFF
jgi:hypothetical protein